MGHRRESQKDQEMYERFRESIKRHTQPKLVKYGKVIWQSDDEPWNLCNKFILEKATDGIALTFESRKEYSDVFSSSSRDFVVNISNSGSRYEPFNLCFVQFFRELQTPIEKTSDAQSSVAGEEE